MAGREEWTCLGPGLALPVLQCILLSRHLLPLGWEGSGGKRWGNNFITHQECRASSLPPWEMGARSIHILPKRQECWYLMCHRKASFRKERQLHQSPLPPHSHGILSKAHRATSSLRKMDMHGVGGMHSLFPGLFSLAAVISIHTLKKTWLWEASPTMWPPPGYSPLP